MKSKLQNVGLYRDVESDYTNHGGGNWVAKGFIYGSYCLDILSAIKIGVSF